MYFFKYHFVPPIYYICILEKHKLYLSFIVIWILAATTYITIFAISTFTAVFTFVFFNKA